MGFQVVKAGSGRPESFRPLGEGEISIGKSGMATLHADDLELVQIVGDRCVLLADPEHMRLGLRVPAGSEPTVPVRKALTSGKKKRDTGRRIINVLPALREMRIEPAKISGRYAIRTKDNLLIVNLAAPSRAEKSGAGRAPNSQADRERAETRTTRPVIDTLDDADEEGGD